MKTITEWKNEALQDWALMQTEYAAESEGSRETLFTLTNGFYGCRGNLELPSAGRTPCVCLAGVYDKPDRANDADTFGLSIRNKAITPAYAIAPLWNLVELDVDGASVDFLNAEVKRFERTLDMRRGLLISHYVLKDSEGRSTRLQFLSAALLSQRSGFVMQCEVEPLDYEGSVTVRFLCDQPDTPQYIPRLKDYISQTEYLGGEELSGAVAVSGRVVQTGEVLSLISRTVSESAQRRVIVRPRGMAETFRFDARPGEAVSFERFCAIGPGTVTLPEETPDVLLERHVALWKEKWNSGDFSFEGDDELLTGVRWNLFSLHALGHFHSPDVSIAATGLHGQGYFGHVFWDTEIFMLPFYLLANPSAAKDLLLYRYNRLDAARQVAKEHGFEGAKFPWTSAKDGYDVCPPDWDRCGKRQIHISGDIAYAFQNHLDWTGDNEFFFRHGVEVIAETARFFRSRMVEGEDAQLHILDVIGPDEYNIHADDNWYTNHLAQWNLRRAVEAMRELQEYDPECYAELCAKIDWTEDESRELATAADRIAFPRLRDNVCEQYRGFFDLKDIGTIKRDQNNMPVEKLHAYDKGYQILKQADAVMMHFLFPDEFSEEMQQATFDYYEQRNSFGSSLSPSISCIMGLRLGMAEHAYGYFRLTSLLDVKDLHLDKNTHEGIHAACAGGAAMAAFFGFGGISVKNGVLTVDPVCPAEWRNLRLRFRFRGEAVEKAVP